MSAVQKLLPEATLGRMTLYLRALAVLQDAGTPTVSSEVLAEAAGVNSSILRKDLSLLGSFGTRGVGYEVKNLADTIAATLGLTRDWRVVILGAGNLGRALAGYAGFHNRGFRVRAIFDVAAGTIGRQLGGLEVQDVTRLREVVRQVNANMAVLAVPGAAAQQLCDQVMDAGISNILSFAPVVLQVRDGVRLRKVDLARELQILAYHASNGA